MQVKEIIPNLNKPITYNGSKYIFTGGIVRKDEQGIIFYQAKILDKNKNSVCIVKSEDITL